MLKAVLYQKHGVCNHPSIPQVDAIFPSYIVRNGARPGDRGTGLRSGNTQLRDLIIAGRAKPSQIVSHRLPLSQAPDAFQKFDQRIDGYIKVILDPQR